MNNEKITSDGLSSAQRAILKRGAGKTLMESGRALTAFYAARPAWVAPWQEERYFAALCMACMWKPEERGEVAPMEECLRRMRSKSLKDSLDKRSDSLDKRVAALLDTEWSDGDGLLNTKLSRLARRIRSGEERVSPDFSVLYDDLLKWNYGSRAVQKKWARAYFGDVTEE